MDFPEALVDEKERIRNIDLAIGEISTKFATEVCAKLYSPFLICLTSRVGIALRRIPNIL